MTPELINERALAVRMWNYAFLPNGFPEDCSLPCLLEMLGHARRNNRHDIGDELAKVILRMTNEK